MIATGEPLPPITLPDQDGRAVDLASFRGKAIVLFFYPADHTPGCTREVCSFRDAYQDFLDAGAVVLGVSGDGGTRHQMFIAKHELPYPLLTDKGGAVAKQLGITKKWGIMGGRVTLVIDGDGIVRHTFENQFQATKHIPEALQALKALA